MPGGRPSKFTDEVKAGLCEHISNGLTDAEACTLVGIGTTAFYEWKAKGEQAQSGQFAEFADSIQKARVRHVETHLGVIRRAATEASVEVKEVVRQNADGTTFTEVVRTTKPPSWQPSAWTLERLYPERFGRRRMEPPAPQLLDETNVVEGAIAAQEPDPDLTPAAFAREILGVDLSDKQLEMLALAHGNRRSAFAGAHASGKTYAVGAVFVFWWLWRYDDGIALVTATKLDQTGRLWNEIRQFWNTCPRLRAGLGPSAELLDRTLRISPVRYAERFTAAVSVSGGDPQATGAQGAHSKSGRVLIIVEEADGVDIAVYNALEGSMSSAESKMVMLFNPLRRSGPAYNAMRSAQWAKMNISGFDSPNLEGETVESLMARYDADPEDPWFDADPVPYLTGRRYMLELWLRCGQHGDRDWFGRGLGVYAPQGERAIFDANMVEALNVPQSFNRAAADRNPRYRLRIGIDWSAGRGGDRFSIAVIQPAEDGYRLVDLHSTNRMHDTLDWAMGVITPHLYHTGIIGVDTTGGGEEMFNRLRDALRDYPMESKPPIVRVNFGSAALDRDSYANKRAEIYFGLHHRIRSGRFHADLPEDVHQQMIQQTFEYDAEGRLRVLPKHLQKERGLASPDELDAICVAAAPLERWRPQTGQVGGMQ